MFTYAYINALKSVYYFTYSIPTFTPIFLFADWKTDLWHWREAGGKVLQFEGMMARKKPYKTLLANGETSNAFTRTAYWIESFPLRFLVVYEEDSSKQEKFPHGNSKSETKLRKIFLPRCHHNALR